MLFFDKSIKKIKSVIDRDGATCRNSNRLDTPLDEHSIMFLRDGPNYQTYYLPCFAVDKNITEKYKSNGVGSWLFFLSTKSCYGVTGRVVRLQIIKRIISCGRNQI